MISLPTYPKINTIFNRDPTKGKKNNLIIGEFSCPEFEYLQDTEWLFTEKIDGMNIRIHRPANTKTVFLGGRDNNSQIPADLVNFLNQRFVANLPFHNLFDDDSEVTIFGEGYGIGIGPGGNYLDSGCGFILFDILIGSFWLYRKDILNIAGNLGLDVVPELGSGTLEDAVDIAQQGFPSQLSAANQEIGLRSKSVSTPLAEGIVLRPAIDLFNHKKERIMAKIKHKDF